MPSDSLPSGDPNKQDLISTLGNPHASEEDWINASQALGEVKQQKSNAEKRDQKKKLLADAGILVALGAGVLGLFSLTHTANVTPTAVPSPPPPMAAPNPAVKRDKEVDFGPYMAALQKKIKKSWHPPSEHANNRVVVLFDLSNDGKLSKLKLDKSSGIPENDKAAIDAVNDSSREFSPLPEGAPDHVSIQFTFGIKVVDSKDRKTTQENIPPFTSS